MQDFDALRNRVEATAQKLTSFHTERQDQVQSLVDILRQLEERHAAQEQQLSYYRKRVEPLEQANQQLVGLMENLLDLIDGGFGEESLVPLRTASEMASSMLANDLFLPESAAADNGDSAEAAVAGCPDPAADDGIMPEFGPGDDAERNAGEIEGRFADASAFGGMQMDDDDDGFQAGDPGAEGVTDLEMEEDALISLDELLELASDEGASQPVSFENAAPPVEKTATFDDVSPAALDRETQEEAAGGLGDLPAVVRAAAAEASGADPAADTTPADPAMASFDEAVSDAAGRADADAAPAAASEDEVEALSAITRALEQGTTGEGGPPPAPSDIRALLLRVEALARKAESMRLAQRESDVSAKPGGGLKQPPKQTGAAA